MEKINVLDLSIGNFVKIFDDIVRITNISEDTVTGKILGTDKQVSQSIKLLEGVEVTEELLTKFDFINIPDFGDYTNVWQLGSFIISLDVYINVVVDWLEEDSDSVLCYEQIYLHDLQNVYYTLMQKEL